MSNHEDDGDDGDDGKPYEVGYRKPPKATRFRPGRSGNSVGRRRKTKTPTEVLAEVLTKKVRVTVNGKAVSQPALAVLSQQALVAALGSDLAPLTKLHKLVSDADRNGERDRKRREREAKAKGDNGLAKLFVDLIYMQRFLICAQIIREDEDGRPCIDPDSLPGLLQHLAPEDRQMAERAAVYLVKRREPGELSDDIRQFWKETTDDYDADLGLKKRKRN